MDVPADQVHDVEFVWPHTTPTDVIVTGTFDKWSSSIHLAKGDVGFSGTVKVPWAEKVTYKFIVDGYWLCRDDQPQEDDGHGNINNFLQVPEKPALPTIQELPAVHAEQVTRLTISPSDGAPSEGEGHGDVETVVTVPKSVRATEPVTSVTTASDLELDTTSPPTEESVASVTSPTHVEISSQSQLSASSPVVLRVPIVILPVNDSTMRGSASPSLGHQDHKPVVAQAPQPNGSREPHGASTPSTHAPVQFTKIRFGASVSPTVVPKAAKLETLVRLESAAVEPSHPSDVTEAVPIPTEAVVADVLVPAPTSVLTISPEILIQQADAPSPPEIGIPSDKKQVSVPAPSISSPSPATPSSKFSITSHKKRRSLFARIKGILSKDKSKESKH